MFKDLDFVLKLVSSKDITKISNLIDAYIDFLTKEKPDFYISNINLSFFPFAILKYESSNCLQLLSQRFIRNNGSYEDFLKIIATFIILNNKFFSGLRNEFSIEVQPSSLVVLFASLVKRDSDVINEDSLLLIYDSVFKYHTDLVSHLVTSYIYHSKWRAKLSTINLIIDTISTYEGKINPTISSLRFMTLESLRDTVFNFIRTGVLHISPLLYVVFVRTPINVIEYHISEFIYLSDFTQERINNLNEKLFKIDEDFGKRTLLV